ncbi:chemotaxis-specific protein-glutamate methyltransferase CheB [Oxalobacteraceae bacterium OM1]|nr:chemotaxis-specific protein-glutamate methyltransferase CheB [Oxalobacteraceae bacterium OM1]
MKIGIVNDMLLIGEALRRVVAKMPEHQVAWVARSGEQAIAFCAQHRPDLILMDLVMPGMDGIDTTRRIMQDHPCAILVVTASPEENTSLVFRALGAGALDVTATPVLAGSNASGTALMNKIRTMARLIRADTGSVTGRQPAAPPLTESELAGKLVAFGASTGGPVALARILSAWRPPAHVAVVVIQHIDAAFADSFAGWLQDQCGQTITVAEDGAAVRGGQILVAKTNDHLTLDAALRLRYSPEPASYPYRPSVNVFFRDIARHWRNRAAGILLTGMGRDGAEGLLAMRRAGKFTIAQDRQSSAVYGMPRAAAEVEAADMILPLEEIAGTLQARCGTA